MAIGAKPNRFHLVTFDPGGTIGWTHFIVHFRAFSRPENKVLRYIEAWECGEFTGSEFEQIGDALNLINEARWGPMPYVSKVDVVTEDFDLVQTVGGKELVSPLRINAVLDWMCLTKFSLPLIYQKRQARTQITVERLQLFGFDNPLRRDGRWVSTGRGKDAFAAMQHALTWLRHLKREADRRPWKLEDGAKTNARWDCACAHGRPCNLTHPR